MATNMATTTTTMHHCYYHYTHSFIDHFPGKAGLASCSLDSQSSLL